MAIQVDEDGQVEKMTRDEFEKQLKDAKTQADEAAAKVAELAKAKEEGRVVEPPAPKVKPEVKSDFATRMAAAKAEKAGEKQTNNMVELRERLENLKSEIEKLGTTTPGYASGLASDLKVLKEQVQYVYDYVKKNDTPAPKSLIDRILNR